MQDREVTIEDLKKLLAKFRDERKWKKYHDPKDLALSIVIEAAELLEYFQWQDGKARVKDKKVVEELKSEIADVVIYCLFLADDLEIDVADAVKKKVDKISKKYPKGMKDLGLGREKYLAIKKSHRRQSTN